MKNPIVSWVVLISMVVLLATNVIAGITISQQQVAIGNLQQQVLGLATVTGQMAQTNSEIDASLQGQIGDLVVIQGKQMDLLKDLFQNDVETLKILDRLVSLAGQ